MTYIGSLNYDEQLKKAKGIIIFGGGSMLGRLLERMRQMELTEKIVAVCDNSVSLQKQGISGIPVLSPEYACEKYRDMDFIVYNRYFMEICEQLRKSSITRIHLIRQGSL